MSDSEGGSLFICRLQKRLTDCCTSVSKEQTPSRCKNKKWANVVTRRKEIHWIGLVLNCIIKNDRLLHTHLTGTIGRQITFQKGFHQDKKKRLRPNNHIFQLVSLGHFLLINFIVLRVLSFISFKYQPAGLPTLRITDKPNLC